MTQYIVYESYEERMARKKAEEIHNMKIIGFIVLASLAVIFFFGAVGGL